MFKRSKKLLTKITSFDKINELPLKNNKKQQKISKKSCWQRRQAVIEWTSCRWDDNKRTLTNKQYIPTLKILKKRRMLKPPKRFSENEQNLDIGKNGKARMKILAGTNHILRWEFDPGSGWTLAACLTHASRTRRYEWSFRMDLIFPSGGRVSNAWVTCLIQGDNS